MRRSVSPRGAQRSARTSDRRMIGFQQHHPIRPRTSGTTSTRSPRPQQHKSPPSVAFVVPSNNHNPRAHPLKAAQRFVNDLLRLRQSAVLEEVSREPKPRQPFRPSQSPRPRPRPSRLFLKARLARARHLSAYQVGHLEKPRRSNLGKGPRHPDASAASLCRVAQDGKGKKTSSATGRCGC